MHDDDEIRRLKRFIVLSWAALLLIVVGLVLWGSVQIRSLNSAVQLADSKQPTVIHGIDGKDGQTGATGAQGLSGADGANGTNGTNGQNVTADQIAQAVSDYLAANPPATVQGIQGIAGRDLSLQVTASCQLQSKYSDDVFWTTLAQLVQPCEPQ